MEDSILIYDGERGFGEVIWNACAICSTDSIKTTFWEDGSVEHNECLICRRMWEIMELEDSLSVKENR